LSGPGPSISVVVPTFDRQASLFRLLAALATQSHPPVDIEVVVVDDGSTDGTPARLRGSRFPFTLRTLSQVHAGPAAARNLGVGAASGGLIVFFDDDVVPAADAIERHVAAHHATPDAVVIGPMLPPEDWRRPAWIRWEEQKLLAQYEAMRRGDYPCTPRQLFTANASVSRSRFLESGGFDIGFARAEDVELGYRLEALGLTFVFDPTARVWHFPGRSLASWCAVPRRYGEADVAMCRDKGHRALRLALEEFHGRQALSRWLARSCVGRPVRMQLATSALMGVVSALDGAKLGRAAGPALSALFNLLYWEGVSDSLGGPAVVWEAVSERRPPVALTDPEPGNS
jgi:GT2 family glycosyltransferase